MGKRRKFLKILLAFLIGCCILWCLACINVFDCSDDYKDKSFPEVQIDLNNIDLKTLNSDKSITYSNNKICVYDETASEIFYDDKMSIKGHGSWAWKQEHKSYTLKFKNDINLFGLGKSDKWNLISCVYEYSYTRSGLATYMAKLLDIDKVLNGKYVVLKIGNDVLGTYWLTQRPRINHSTLKVKDGGCIFEASGIEGDTSLDDEEPTFISKIEKRRFFLKDDKGLDSSIISKSFEDSYNKLEEAIFNSDWDSIKKQIDVESFVNYFVLYEIMCDRDSFWRSFYFYRNDINDVIHVSPVWDFDNCFRYNFYDEVYSAKYFYVGNFIENTTAFSWKLMNIPEFKKLCKKIYHRKILYNKQYIWNYIETNKQNLKINECTNSIYEDGIRDLKTDLSNRLNFLDLVWFSNKYLPDGDYVINSISFDDPKNLVVQNTENGYFKLYSPSKNDYVRADKSLCQSHGIDYLNFEQNEDDMLWFLCYSNEENAYVFVSKLTGQVIDLLHIDSPSIYADYIYYYFVFN